MAGDEVCRAMRADGYEGVVVCVSGNAFSVREIRCCVDCGDNVSVVIDWWDFA